MFHQSLPIKNHKPLFASDVYPDSKPKKTKNTLPQTLNNYEIIRDKVLHEMQSKVAPSAEAKQTGKKKLLNF
jgi:hypothetical protein